MSLLTASVFIFLLIALSALVSSSELALASARKIKLQVMAKEGEVRALDVLNMQEHPGSLLPWYKSRSMRWPFWPVSSASQPSAPI